VPVELGDAGGTVPVGATLLLALALVALAVLLPVPDDVADAVDVSTTADEPDDVPVELTDPVALAVLLLVPDDVADVVDVSVEVNVPVALPASLGVALALDVVLALPGGAALALGVALAVVTKTSTDPFI